MRLPGWLRWRSGAELDEEIQAHLDMEIRANLDRGLTAEEARMVAKRRFGSAAVVRERARESEPFFRFETLLKDTLFGIRTLLRAPGFATVAILSLASGLAAIMLTFIVLDAVFLRPLPVEEPDALVRFVTRETGVGTRSQFPLRLYEDWRDGSTTVESIFAEAAISSVLTDPGPPEVVSMRTPTPGFFEILGVQPLHGRALTAQDDRLSSGAIPAVLSHEFWQRRFGGDSGVIGRGITVAGEPLIVVGVMPVEFNGVTVDTGPDIRVPLSAYPRLSGGGAGFPERGGVFDLGGRLRQGGALRQAEAEARVIWQRTMAEYYRDVYGMNDDTVRAMLDTEVGLDPLEHGVSVLRERFGVGLLLLFAGAGLILTIVAINVAGMALARSARRRTEMAVRLALGASRRRLCGQILTESLLLVVPAALLGMVFAQVGLPILIDALPPLRGAGTNAIPIVLPLELDGRTLTFAGVAVAIAALVVGLPSASGAMRLDWAATSRVFRSPLRWRSRGALLTAESALCVVLLAGAGLLVRTVVELRSVPTGLDANRVLTITLAPYLAGYSASESAIFRDRAVEDVRLLPGVESASTSMVGPMRGSGLKTSIAPTGQRVTATDELASSINEAGPGYFRTMGMDLVAGRDFLPSDEPGQAPAPAVINQALARRYFSDQNPLGRTFGLGQPDIAQANYRVIGIVSDAKYRSMREPVPPTFFTPERSALTFELVARSTSPRSLSEPIGRAIEAIDPNVPVLEVHALDEEVEASIAAERLLASVTSAFGVAAVAMTAIGVYGLFAQFVSERRRELGIRLAVGANSRDVRLMVVRQAFGMIAPGLAIGLGATLLSGRLIESLIYGVRSQDPASIVVALLVVGLSGIAGAWIPARQAGKTDPASVLRAEG